LETSGEDEERFALPEPREIGGMRGKKRSCAGYGLAIAA